MASVTICSDLGAQENKVCHYFHCFPIYLPLSEGTRCHDLCFLNVEFKPTFSLSSFSFIKRLFSSSLLSAIRLVSSDIWGYWYFSLQVSIPACASSSLAFCIMYSAYKLNKQGDNIHWLYIDWYTPFPIWNQSFVPCWVCYFLTCTQISQEEGKVVWYSHLSKNFPQFFVIHTVNDSSILNEEEVDSFLEFPCFYYDYLISGSSAFSKSSLSIWKFLVHYWTKYCWSFAWRILSTTLLVCEMSTTV